MKYIVEKEALKNVVYDLGEIEEGAFDYVIPEGVKKIVNESTDGYLFGFKSLYIPESVESIDIGAFFVSSSRSNITVAKNNPYFVVDGGCLIEKNSKKLIIGTDNGTIPDWVEIVGERAFNGLESLTSVSIPSSVKKIEYMAFCNTGLKSVEIPESVILIDSFAFALNGIDGTVPKSVRKVGKHIFLSDIEILSREILLLSLNKPNHIDFVVFDVETTGLNCDDVHQGKIISISASKITGQHISEHFFSYISCDDVPEEVTIITGISNDTVKNAPNIEKVLTAFYHFADGCVLCSHNIEFDLKFLNYYGNKYGLEFGSSTLDTLEIAKDKIKGQVKNYTLHRMCSYFNIPKVLSDCDKTACLLMELAKL